MTQSGSISWRTVRGKAISFPENLPVSGQRELIAKAFLESPVIIVCGETGSGKTTQLPKICLALGRGKIHQGGLIGHTQPRRIAATSTAKRIAHELGSAIGEDVSYQVRFADHSSPSASIKLMTDGILLAQTQTDPLLRQYDTIIIDEAHERSLNIDFLLGYLKQLSEKRHDLKIIITSATIDAQRFARHFAVAGKPAPVIEVSGRLYPVEQRYFPLQDEGKKEVLEISEAVCKVIGEIWREGAGDVLVFLPGEREIRDCAEALRKDPFLQQRFHPEILSLFARQAVGEQERIFQAGSNRRIVLATNVAETSLTVPNIRFVIDSGLARVKRYSYRNKVEQLQVEPISQAAANQRAGRCGRVADGICIRLYSEADYQARAAYTDPEILRSSLAAVILRMAALHLPNIAQFPFIDQPLGRAIVDGMHLLEELGAIEPSENLSQQRSQSVQLSAIGQELVELPLDPRVGRILLAAKEQHALKELTIIASAMSCQDPRERPMEAASAADQAHLAFADERSEFLSAIKLWNWYQDALKHQQSHRQLEALCRSQFLSPRRLREWRDVHGQLHVLLAEKGWKENQSPASYEQIHTALLTGLLGYIGKRDEDTSTARGQKSGDYLGARGMRLFIWPGSSMGKKLGAWFLAGEIQETTRLYARTLAKIEPQWIERVAAHRLLKTLSDPFWDKERGEVLAYERATLYGLPIYHGRRVTYAPHDPLEAHQLFIQKALVEGEMFGKVDTPTLEKETQAEAKKRYGTLFAFFWHNRQLIREIEALEHRSRRPDVLVDDQLLFAFYAEWIPTTVYSRSRLQAWLELDREQTEHKDQSLRLQKSDLMRHAAAGVTVDRYPKTITMNGITLHTHYHFEPGNPKDGITLIVPLTVLNQVDAIQAEWLVPGLCVEKVQLLLKSLPPKIRRHCIPLPDSAQQFVQAQLDANAFAKGDLLDALMEFIRSKNTIEIKRADFRLETVPPHCFMNFRLVDEHGRQLELERNLNRLRTEYGGIARDAFQNLADQSAQRSALESDGEHAVKIGSGLYQDWGFGDLPEVMEIQKGGLTFQAYPALLDRKNAVEVELLDDPQAAKRAHLLGLRRLYTLVLKENVKALQKQLPHAREISLLFMSIGSVEELTEQMVMMAVERAFMHATHPRTKAEFEESIQQGKPRFILIAGEIAKHVLSALHAYAELHKKLSNAKALSNAAYEDMRQQVQGLISAHFLQQTPYEQLVHLPRYLKAILLRIEKLRSNPSRDIQCQRDWESVARPWQKIMQSNQGGGQFNREQDLHLREFRWQLEELRVALFAQELRTPVPMSVKRLEKVLSRLR
jgi:ATP-dependent helicase HrpA